MCHEINNELQIVQNNINYNYWFYTAEINCEPHSYIEIEEKSIKYLLEEWFDYEEFTNEINIWKDYLNDNETVCVILHVYTNKSHRKKGIARKLLEESLKYDTEYILNASPMEAEITVDTLTKLYKSVGFTEMYCKDETVVMYRHKKDSD